MIEKFENWLKLDEEAQIDNLKDILQIYLNVGRYSKEEIDTITNNLSLQQRKFFYATIYNLVWNLESLQTQIRGFRNNVLKQLVKFEDIITPQSIMSENLSQDSEDIISSRFLFQEVGKELTESKKLLFELIDGGRTIAELAECLEVTSSYVSQVISEWEDEGLIIKERRGRRVIPVKSPKFLKLRTKNDQVK